MSSRLWVVPSALFVLTLLAGPAIAQPSSDLNLNVAAQTTLLRLTDSDSISAGVGGRFAWDFSRFVSADVEGAFFPRDNFVITSSGLSGETLVVAYHRHRSDVFGGVKAGMRGNRFGLFGKVRPGLTRLSDEGVECVGTMCALALFMRPEYKTEFAVDIGGIFEFYPTRRTIARFDLGDVMIRNRSVGVPPCADCLSHNLTSRFGVGVKF